MTSTFVVRAFIKCPWSVCNYTQRVNWTMWVMGGRPLLAHVWSLVIACGKYLTQCSVGWEIRHSVDHVPSNFQSMPKCPRKEGGRTIDIQPRPPSDLKKIKCKKKDKWSRPACRTRSHARIMEMGPLVQTCPFGFYFRGRSGSGAARISPT